ncbi:MAG: TetR family transcriptional regulator [Luteolibacter sp.]
MRAPIIPESGPKRKLLDAAEQLFAEKGFEAVSVRDITKLANANVAAVNYHFGSREGLLTMVMTRYLAPVNEERMALLDEAERRAGGKALSVEEIIIAMSRPLINQVMRSEMSEQVFCKLLARVISEQNDDLSFAVETHLRSAAHRFYDALEKALPDVSREEIAWRLHFTHGAVVKLLYHQEMFKRVAEIPDATLEESFQRFIRYAVAGMCQQPASAPVKEAAPAKMEKVTPQGSFDF